MTNFEASRRIAAGRAQQLMDPYGLEINTSTSSGHYTDNSLTCFALSLHTKRRPVRGNKALIEKLRTDGFLVETFRTTDPFSGVAFMEFIVIITQRILTGEVKA